MDAKNALSPGGGNDSLDDRSTRFLRSLVRHAPFAAAVVDEDRALSFLTPGAARLLGLDPGQTPGPRLLDVIHPDDHDRLEGHLARCTEGALPCREAWYRVRQGSDGWARVAVCPAPAGEDSDIDGLILYLRAADPVSAYLGGEDPPTPDESGPAALPASAALLHRVISHVPVVVYVLDAEGTFQLSEGRGLEALGLEPGQVVGQSVFEVYADWPEALESVRNVFAGKEVTDRYEIAGRFFDGRMTPIYEDDEVVGLLGISLDVTEAAERSADARLRAELLEHVGQAVIATDATGSIIFWNRAAERMFGWTSEEVLGRSVGEVTVAEDAAGEAEAIMARLREGKRWEGVFSVRRRDGSTVPGYICNVPIMDDGEIVAIVGVTTDYTERRELEAKLRQAQKLEAVGRLAGGIAHGFNNLLTSVAGYADLAAARAEDDPQLAADLMAVTEAAERGRGLVEKLLAFSRQSQAAPRPVDVNETLRGLVGMLDRSLGGDIPVELELGEELWPARVDPFQLEQNVLNLVLNARDAMPGGGTVTIRTDRVTLGGERASSIGDGIEAGDYVRIRVRDTGSGIPPELRDQVFEPFFTTKGVGKATGLGLSIVYGSVTQAGGAVELEHGDGTTAVLYLPRASLEEGAERPARSEPTEPKREPGSPAGAILLVEDEASVRQLAKRVLERGGYRVVPAEHGGEALRMVEGGLEPVLVLTDVIMPEMAGPELIQRLRATGRDFPSLFMSGYTADELTSRGLDEREENFLAKPFTPDQLLAAVRAALSD